LVSSDKRLLKAYAVSDGAQQQVKMIGHQGPGKAESLAFTKNAPKPVKKIIAVGVVPKNRTPLDSSNHSMLRGIRHIQAGFAEHEKNLA